MDKNASKAVPTQSVLEIRRKSVKRILGAGGVVAGGSMVQWEWVKPVVQSTLLPAHAQTSPGANDSPAGPSAPDSLSDPCDITVVGCDGEDKFEVMVTGFVTPPVAGVNVDLDYEISGNNPDSGDFGSSTTNSSGNYSVTKLLSFLGAEKIVITASLPDFPAAGSATCSADVNGENDKTGDDSDNYFCDSIS